jgi:NDP-sugar pyrophosphorylase family protein
MKDLTVVLMAGGRGRRLRPLTDNTPKPLLRVGGRTILDRVLDSLDVVLSHDTPIWVCTGFRSDQIEQHLSDRPGIGISRDRFSSGTAGPIRWLPIQPRGDLLVVNADLITSVEFREMVEQHRAKGSAITVGARWHREMMPYGVLECDGGSVAAIREKPTRSVLINCGIYVLSEGPWRDIMASRHPYCLNMPDVVEKWANQTDAVHPFGIHGRWIDIGTPDQYAEAQRVFGTDPMQVEVTQ